MAEKQPPSIVHNHFHEVKLFKEQELGHGSFATVCRAQCDDLPCAAKVLHAKFFDQQDPDPGEQTFISRFVEECKILPSIVHPNIVQCFGMYQDPDTNLPVLLMELMDESLMDYIEHFCDPAPYHIQISFSYDIALGLSYLHSRGYIHRDLSSNNVLIMAGIRAKISDFGTCRAITNISRQTRLTVCPGTPPFMPPEALLEPPKYTDKLDIFALGVIMIQIMSRQYPNPGPAHMQVPSSMLLQAIPEEERRSNHIKLIRYEHPMLPLAKECIRNSEEKRPSSRDICNDLRSLKESCEYQQSKDEVSVERKLEKESQLHQMQLTKIMMEMHDKIAKMKEEHSQHIESIHHYYGQHERELQLQLTKTTKDMQNKIETVKAEHSQQIESIQLQHERELQLQLTKTTMPDMQNKIETMKAEHNQQIETIHRHYCEHEGELQHQLTKILMDMQDKIETMKAEHSQQIHFHYHKLEIESQLQLNKITRDMKNKLDEIKTLHHHETEDIHRYYNQQNSHDHIDHLSAMTTTSNDHDHDGINHSYTSDNSGPAPVHSEAHGRLESASAHPSKPSAMHVSNVLSGSQVSTKSKVGDNKENLAATILVTDDEGMTTVELVDSGLNLSNNEAHTRFDSGSPHPNLESKPSVSNALPDPISSTPPERAYSGEKVMLMDIESSVDADWIKVDLTDNETDSKDCSSTLDNQSRPRERVASFNTMSGNRVCDELEYYQSQSLLREIFRK